MAAEKPFRFNKYIRPFILFPNLPFIIILCACILYMIYKNTPYFDFWMNDELDLTEEIGDFIKRVYPKEIALIISIFFYFMIIVSIL
ncbi:MAG: hypothetical protein WAS34_18970 [Thiolinea sp.]